MNNPSNIPLSSLAEPQHGLAPVLAAAAEGPAVAIAPPVIADRIYQIAAVTAGLFLLATLL